MNKKILLITSIIILLPILFGVLNWEQLPDIMATHWNINNEVDGTMPKEFVVFGLPLILLGVQLSGSYFTTLDKKNKNTNFVLWIIPTISLLCGFVIYSTAFNYTVNISLIATLLLGVLFVIMGLYMPKVKQNYTVGIKIPTTLNNEENWNKTHAYAGKLWIAIGVLIMLFAILGLHEAAFGSILCAVIIPIIYSVKLSRMKR